MSKAKTYELELTTQRVASQTEIANNGYRDGFSNLNNTEDSFVKDGGVSVDQRKMNAVRAYFEWMPIRQVDLDDNLRIWRSFQLGKLVDLIIIDTRNYDRSITDLGKAVPSLSSNHTPHLPFTNSYNELREI